MEANSQIEIRKYKDCKVGRNIALYTPSSFLGAIPVG